MTRRRHLPPDTRPKWDDPNLPVTRDYRMADGSRRTEIDPDYERRYREHMVATAPHPSYKADPTYNLSRRRPAAPSTKSSGGDR